MLPLNSIPFPTAFLTTFDIKTGVERFEAQDQWILKMLTKLYHVMERWVARGDCFYARFQDDIILSSRKRHVLRQMRKEMFQMLDQLRLGLRPEKTFVGRSEKGFDLLGYHISLQGFSPSQKTQEKALENARQGYAQGGYKSLLEYLKRWRTWVHAGLPLKVHSVEDVIDYIVGTFFALKDDLRSCKLTKFRSITMIAGHNIQR